MQIKDTLGFEFKKMNDRIKRHIHLTLAREGFDELTVMHGWILGYLHRHEGAACQKDLESQFGIGKSTVTNILQLMEKKGYLTRTEDEKDGRIKRLKLTALGERTHMESIQVIDEIHQNMEEGITEEEREVFYRVLTKIRKNIEHKEETF